MFKSPYKQKFTLIILCISLITAKTIDIPSDYLTIQEGIDASVNGDTVLVQPGTYIENLTIQGKDIILASLFITTSDTSYISNTIIDGSHIRSAIEISHNTTNKALISGFTIVNGGTTAPGSNSRGGGIYCDNASPRLSYLIIKDNSVSRFGGGIYLSEYFGDITNVIIRNNICGDDGGGLYAHNSNFSIF